MPRGKATRRFDQDYTDWEFGKWTAVRKGERKHHWLCRCVCGTEREIAISSLVDGRSTACGCDRAEKTTRRFTTHGFSKTRVYRIYHAMCRRCNSPSVFGYEHYGGRGIKVCERWSDFTNFLEDMGHPPEGYSIDRIDNDGDYEPSNCRWSSKTEQMNNRRSSSVSITMNGVTHSLGQWCKLLGVNYMTMRWRIECKKMDPVEALQTPVNGSGKKKLDPRGR